MVIILVHKLVIVLVPNIVIILVLAFSQHIDFIILFHFSELLIVGPIPPFLRSELLIREVSVILLKSTVNMVIVITNQQVKTYLCLAMVTSVSLKKKFRFKFWFPHREWSYFCICIFCIYFSICFILIMTLWILPRESHLAANPGAVVGEEAYTEYAKVGAPLFLYLYLVFVFSNCIYVFNFSQKCYLTGWGRQRTNSYLFRDSQWGISPLSSRLIQRVETKSAVK